MAGAERDPEAVGRALLGDGYPDLLAGLAELDPELAEHVVSFGFGGLLARPVLAARDRALSLAAALAGDGRAPDLLTRQLRGAIQAGWTSTQVREIAWQLYLYGGLAAVERCRPAFLAALGPAPSRRGSPEALPDDDTLYERGLANGTRLHGETYLRRRERMRAVDPELSTLEVRHAYGRVYERAQLGPRDRALVTISVQLGLRLTDQLSRHLVAARRAGLTQAEVREIGAQTILYLGWPVGNGAVLQLEDVLREADLSQ